MSIVLEILELGMAEQWKKHKQTSILIIGKYKTEWNNVKWPKTYLDQ